MCWAASVIKVPFYFQVDQRTHTHACVIWTTARHRVTEEMTEEIREAVGVGGAEGGAEEVVAVDEAEAAVVRLVLEAEKETEW